MNHKNENHQTFKKMSFIQQASGQANTQNTKFSYMKYILGLLLFGLNGIVSSKINLSSMSIVFFRTLFGSVLLGLIYLLGKILVGKKKDQKKLKICRAKSETVYVIISGVAMGLSWIFLYEAYVRIGVGMSSIAYYCGPVIVMIATPLVFKKKITPLQKACFAGVFLGIILVSVPDLISDAHMDAFGLLCGFISAVLHAFMVIFTMKAPNITGEKNAMMQLVVSFLTVALFALFKGGVTLPTGKTEWFWMLFLGFVNTGFGCYLYFCDIAKLPVVSVSILGYLEPLSAVIFAVILLGEHLSVFEIAGGVLILVGAAMASVF